MTNIKSLLNNILGEGNFAEYLLLFGIAVFIIIILIAIILCIKSLLKSGKEAIKQETKSEMNFEKIKALLPDTKVTDEEPTMFASKMDLEALSEEMSRVIETESPNIEEYEAEQEESSIISYEELIQAANARRLEPIQEEMQETVFNNDNIYEIEEITDEFLDVHQMEEHAVTSYDELLNLTRQKVAAIKNKKNNPDRRFKPSQFISPVYGVDKKSNQAFELDTLEMAHISEEVSKTAEFLQELKEFRKSLD